jgi:hypothetical protein
VGRYGIERGDVLLSIQMTLTREAERSRPRLVPVGSPRPVGDRLRPTHRPSPQTHGSPEPATSLRAVVREAREMRRDRMLEQSWPLRRPGGHQTEPTAATA